MSKRTIAFLFVIGLIGLVYFAFRIMPILIFGANPLFWLVGWLIVAVVVVVIYRFVRRFFRSY